MPSRFSNLVLFKFGLALLFLSAGARSAADGPYVVRSSAGIWQAQSVQDTADGVRKWELPVKEGEALTVPAVGGLPAFDVKVRGPASPGSDSIKTRTNAPIFVVADTHGEYELLVAMLQKHGVVDAKLKWSFGRGHLVILGDVFDRGPNHLEILWLLYALEDQARRAGGGSHLILGNHEVMVLSGDLRYLNPKYAATAATLGVDSYSQLFSADSLLGQWLRSRPAVLKINDLLCVHGGISPALVAQRLSLADINTELRMVVAGASADSPAQRDRRELLSGANGPLWYRGYFPEHADFAQATGQDIDRALLWFGVARILVGHTIVAAITPLYGGKVIAVQVYPRRDAAGQVSFESLRIERGEFWRATLAGRERLALPPAVR